MSDIATLIRDVLVKLVDKVVDFKVLLLIFLVVGLLKINEVILLLKSFEFVCK